MADADIDLLRCAGDVDELADALASLLTNFRISAFVIGAAENLSVSDVVLTNLSAVATELLLTCVATNSSAGIVSLSVADVHSASGMAYQVIFLGGPSELADVPEDQLKQVLSIAVTRAEELVGKNNVRQVTKIDLGSIETRALQMLSQGYSLHRISASTMLSVNTVKLVLKSIRKKLDCASLAHAVSRAHRLGIIN